MGQAGRDNLAERAQMPCMTKVKDVFVFVQTFVAWMAVSGCFSCLAQVSHGDQAKTLGLLGQQRERQWKGSSCGLRFVSMHRISDSHERKSRRKASKKGPDTRIRGLVFVVAL